MSLHVTLAVTLLRAASLAAVGFACAAANSVMPVVTNLGGGPTPTYTATGVASDATKPGLNPSNYLTPANIR